MSKQSFVFRLSCLFSFKKNPQKNQPTTTINQKKQQHTKQWVTQTYVHTLKKLKKIRMLSKQKKFNNCLSN